MRRLSSALLVGVATFAAAPSLDAQSIGFKLGASISTLAVEDDATTNLKSATSFAGGGFIRFDMGRFGIQAELLSMTKGADVDAATNDDINFRFEYIEIPLLFHVPLTMGSTFAPYVFAGPALALEIGCEVSTPGVASFDCDEDVTFDRKKTDYGLAVGGGLAFAAGPGAVLLEGRYTWGLQNLSNNESDPSIKNRNAFIAAGYSIPLSR